MALTINKAEKWAQKKKIDKLLKALSKGNKDEKIIVIKAFGATQDENVMYKLIPFLKDPDTSIRSAAVDSLGTIGNGRSLEFVRQMCETEPDENVLERAKLAFALIREKAAKADKHS